MQKQDFDDEYIMVVSLLKFSNFEKDDFKILSS